MTSTRITLAEAIAALVVEKRAVGYKYVAEERVLGTSVLGRPIVAWQRRGSGPARHVAVIGVIHGDEPAGRAVVEALLATPVPANLTLTLIPTMNPDGAARPFWASFASRTGVLVNELYHTFDVNATMLRCQVSNVLPAQAGPPQSGGSIMVAFAEL